jgi:Holliday junction DNA helicase RuvB
VASYIHSSKKSIETTAEPKLLPQANSTAHDPFEELIQADQQLETTLRPAHLEEFCGQNTIRERLEVLIGGAKARKEPLGHCLFCGPPGLGKTTLAQILARSMGVQCVVTSGPVLEKAGDLAGLLSSLKTGDVLFIDEIHRLTRSVEEYLYSAMEDFKLDLMIDSGPGARSVELKLNRFTLVGATTRQGLLTAPLRSRFHLTLRLDYYDQASLASIIRRSSRLLSLDMEEAAAVEIAARSRGTPRIANNLLKWVRDFAHSRQMATAGVKIDHALARIALDKLDVDREGLDEMDRRMLKALIENFSGGPVGLNTLASALSEEPHTIEEVYEPYLILKGFLTRTPRGRCATAKAYEHLKQADLRSC